MRPLTDTGPFIPTWLASLAAVWILLPGGGLAGQEADVHDLNMGSIVRITGATVLRGGPASPPRLFPVVIEGNVVGLRGDTLLFETGNEPVYWIPLGEAPLVERLAAVRDMKRSVLVMSVVSAAAGATFSWGWHDQCRVNQEALQVGLQLTTCPDDSSEGEAVLRGLALGAGVGVVAGVVLSRFVKRQGWVPLTLDRIRFQTMPGTGGVGGIRPGASGLTIRWAVGGRP